MHRFDEAELVERLGRLDERSRVAFALLCCSRLLPMYRRFAERTGRGDRLALGSFAKRLWEHVMGNKISPVDLQLAMDSCVALIPSEDDGWDEETQPYAEDAATGLVYALHAALSGELRYPALAARRAYEALDHYAGRSVEHPENSSYDEQARISHPAVQAELRRQLRDLASLGAATDEDRDETIARLRRHSESENPFVLDTGVDPGHE